MKIFILFFIGLLSYCMIACQQHFEVEAPQELRLDSPQAIKALLKGTYSQLQSNDLYGGNIPLVNELLAADSGIVVHENSGVWKEFYSKKMTPSNPFLHTIWQKAYHAIQSCNLILANLTLLTNEQEAKQVRGEALMIRSLLYYDLLQLFAQTALLDELHSQMGVPLIITPTRTPDDIRLVARSTVKEVYTQIQKDLEEAVSILPTQNTWHFNRYSASALLAKVYLQQGLWEKTAQVCTSILQENAYSLIFPIENVYNNSNPSNEDIAFLLQNEETATQDRSLYTMYTVEKKLWLNDTFLKNYADKDHRKALFSGKEGVFYTHKYKNEMACISLFRITEMYLMRAEANFRIKNSIGSAPLNDINLIRNRSRAAGLVEVNLDIIRKDREMEFIFEGKNLQDKKRFQKSIAGLPYYHSRLVCPIPQREIDINSLLKQNEGY